LTIQLPKFRKDVEVVPRIIEGEGLRYILKDPQSEKIFGFCEEEYFIYRRMDGKTSLTALQDLFFEQFHIPIQREQLEAFIRFLAVQELIEDALEPGEIPWHFPVYYRKHILGNPDRWLQRLAPLFSWCFTRAFVIGLGVLLFMAIIIFINNLSVYRTQARNTLWNSGPFFLETFLGIFVINVVGEFAKALALKHWGGNVPEMVVGLAYRLIPTFHFDLSDVFMKKRREQLRILSAGLLAQTLLWAVGILAWKITHTGSTMHTFWLIFTVAAQFFFLINFIPLLPRDGCFLLGAWLEVPDLFYRSRNLTKAWFFFKPLPEPVTARERLWLKIYGTLSIVFLSAFWLLMLGIIGYVLIWYWKLKGLGACIFLTIVFLRYGDAMKELATRYLSPRSFLNQEGYISRKLLIWIGVLIGLMIIFFIPYPYDAGGNFTVLPVHQVSVRAVVPGEIEKIMVQEGEWVKKGQVLALLLDKDQKAKRESAKEALTAATEKLTMMRKGPKPEEVAKAEQQVKLAATALHFSTVEATRYTNMFREKSVSEEDYMNKLKARDENQENLILAKKNLALVRVPFRPEEIKAQEAEVRRLEAQLTLAEQDLQLTKIVSPAEGRLITAHPFQKVGQYLNAGELLGVLEDARITIAEIEVPENDITMVKLGARVKIRPWALPTETFIGKVTAIAPVGYQENRHRVERVLTEREFLAMQNITDQSRVIRVISEFPENDGVLLTDMTGYAKIHGGWMFTGVAFTRWLVRFIMVEVWSWLP
jgi:putative peptide zinc metalloprotease protein